MTNPKYHAEIDDRMYRVREHLSDPAKPGYSEYDMANHNDGPHNDPHIYTPKVTPQVALRVPKNEDEEFVRRHCNAVRTKFLAVHASLDSLVAKTEYKVVPPADPKTRQAKQATPEEQITIQIKSLSERAYHAATVLGQKISLHGYMEAYQQHETITKEYSSLDKAALNQATVKTIDDDLKHIGERLPDLRLHVQAYEAADWTRLRLYRLRHAAYEFRTEVTSYSIASWRLKKQYEKQFQTTFEEVATCVVEISTQASAVLEQCEYYEQVEELKEFVCTKTIEIQKKFVQLECVVVKLEREAAYRQEQSHFSISQARLSIQRAGVHVSQMLKIAQSIKAQKADWVTQVKTDCRYLQTVVQEAKHEIDCWAERQLCPPPNHCAETSGRLYALTSQALQYANALSINDKCCTSLTSLTDTIDQIDYEAMQWKEKAHDLQTDANFHYEVFDKFWWAIARIRSALCECEGIAEPGEETNKWLAQYFHLQQRLQESVAGVNVNVDFPRHCAQQGVTPIMFDGGTVETPKANWVVPAAGYVEQVHSVLVESQTLIGSAKEVATGVTRVQTEKIARALEIELKWITGHVKAQEVHMIDFRERTLRQWTSFNLATQTALAMAKSEVVSPANQSAIASSYELAAKATKILTIEKQLAAYDTRMKGLLGVQTA
jgi:hypothetical protein